MNPIAVVFAIGVLVVTIVAGIVLGKGLLSSSKVANTAQLVQQIASAMQSHYSAQNNFANISTASEIANGDIPAQIANGGSPLSPMGGSLAITPAASVNGGSNNAAGIEVDGLAQQDCINLATQVAAYATGNTAGATPTTQATGQSPGTTVSDAGAAALCPNASANTLVFTVTMGS